jgi:hypothetical protein
MNYAPAGDPRIVNPTYCAMTRINATLALRWMSASTEFKLLDSQDVASMNRKLSKAVWAAMGDPENAPLGQGEDGKPLLPGPARMQALGFDIFGIVQENGSGVSARVIPPSAESGNQETVPAAD